VFASSLAVHLVPTGPSSTGQRNYVVTGTSGNYLSDIPDLPPATLSSRSAQDVARSHAGGSVVGQPQLMYHKKSLYGPGTAAVYLAWRVNIRGVAGSGDSDEWEYFIDAQSGQVLDRISTSNTGHHEEFNVSVEDANQNTSNDCWNGGVQQWFDEDGPIDNYPGGPGSYPGGDADADLVFAAIGEVYDFFRDNFDRHGHANEPAGLFELLFEGEGEALERLIVHVNNAQFPNNRANASYTSGCDLFQFSNGFVALDMVAHEFTHGVDTYERELIYQNQSGALDESYADMFGAFVDRNWLIGEDFANGAIRDMSDPPQFTRTFDFDGDGNTDQVCVHPDNMATFCVPNVAAADNGGVHVNSGIPNKAGFLITMGGRHNDIVVQGLGWDKAQQLYYAVHTGRLNPNSTFMDARDGTVAQVQEWVDFPDNLCIGRLGRVRCRLRSIAGRSRLGRRRRLRARRRGQRPHVPEPAPGRPRRRRHRRRGRPRRRWRRRRRTARSRFLWRQLPHRAKPEPGGQRRQRDRQCMRRRG
jgi:hypothetical protein